MNRLLVLLCIAALQSGCQVPARMAMETHLPEHPNPTSWLFDRPLDEVKTAIRSAHGPYAMARGEPEQAGVNTFGSVARVLNLIENENDYYLWKPRHPYAWSQVYRSSNGPLPYLVEFHLHVTAVSDGQTRVEVITIKPQVMAWSWRGPKETHYGQDILFDVEPTTVEEYQILLAIGAVLGVQDMPAITLPDGAGDLVARYK